MKTRDRKALLTLALLVLAAFLVVPLARREAVAPHAPRATNPVNVSTEPVSRPTALRPRPGPTVTFLGQTVPAAAEPYLVSAVKCAKFIETEAAKFPPDSQCRGKNGSDTKLRCFPISRRSGRR
jgi:hypothetical protein